MLDTLRDTSLDGLSKAVILEEDLYQPPTEHEIIVYARSIGISPKTEQYLMPIAREGISAPLPDGWKVLQDENNKIFYYNAVTHESMWEHPCDELYRNSVIKRRIEHKRNGNVSRTSQSRENVKIGSSDSSTLRDLTSKNNSGIRVPVNSSENFPDPTFNTTRNSENVSTKESHNVDMVSDVSTTEYQELKPHFVQKKWGVYSLNSEGLNCGRRSQVACQTDVQTLAGTDSWSTAYSSALAKADKNLLKLQTKLRESLLLGKQFVPSPTKRTPTRLSMRCDLSGSARSPQHTLFDELDKQHRKCLQSTLPITNAMMTPLLKTKLVFDSPAFEHERATVENLLSNCPEVGVSPSESKPSNSAEDVLVESNSLNPKKTAIKAVECSAGGMGINSQKKEPIVDNEKSTSAINNHSYVVSPVQTGELTPVTPTPQKSFEVSDCVGHLLEERSRLQTKLLKLKLLYKSYKQRLISLDASLSAVQHLTSPSQQLLTSVVENPNYRRCISNDGDDKQRAVPVHANGRRHFHPKTPDSLSRMNPLMRYKRSSSLPRGSRSTAHSCGCPKSQDLAASLNSLDSQLHHILQCLDLGTDREVGQPRFSDPLTTCEHSCNDPAPGTMCPKRTVRGCNCLPSNSFAHHELEFPPTIPHYNHSHDGTMPTRWQYSPFAN